MSRKEKEGGYSSSIQFIQRGVVEYFKTLVYDVSLLYFCPVCAV